MEFQSLQVIPQGLLKVPQTAPQRKGGLKQNENVKVLYFGNRLELTTLSMG